MHSFLIALAFLTVLPIHFRSLPEPTAIARSRLWFPLVGVLLGLLLAGWTYLLGGLGAPLLASFLILAAWVGITGALHLDGFCDLCDGLFGGHTPEDRLRILKDPRRGSFALVGAVLLLLGKFAALATLLHRDKLLAAWTVGLAVGVARSLVLALAAGAQYPRPEGTGKLIVEATGWPEAALYALLAQGATGLLLVVEPQAVWCVAVLLGAVWFSVLMLRAVCVRRLGGITGDCLGAGIELSETQFLILTALLLASPG